MRGIVLLWVLLLAAPAWAQGVQLEFVAPLFHSNAREAYQAAVDEWNAQHPDVQVNLVSGFDINTDAHDTFVRFLALEDPSLDILSIDAPWIPEFAYPDWLLPLDEYVDSEFIEGFEGSVLSGGQYEGATYALPIESTGNLLYYRTDLLAKYDFEPPRTMDALEHQARTIQAGERMRHGLILHGALLCLDVFPFFWASGGQTVDALGGVHIASDSNIEALDTLARWGREGLLPVEKMEGLYQESNRLPLLDFMHGDAPFTIDWSSRWGLLQAEGSPVAGKVGAVAIPGREVGPGASTQGSWYIAVSRFSRHPTEAAAFARFFTSEAQQLHRVRKLGVLPSRAQLQQSDEVRAVHSGLDQVRTALQTTRPRARVPNARRMLEIIEIAIHKAISGELSAREALEGAAKKLETVRLPARLARQDSTVSIGWDRGPRGDWLRPLRDALAALALLILATLGVLRWNARHPHSVFASIQVKLTLIGSSVIVGLMLIAGAFMSSHALAVQDRELRSAERFYEEQLQQHARTLSKQLALASSLLAETDGQVSISKLMTASHFTEDILFLEVRDSEGRSLFTDQDHLRSASDKVTFPEPEDLKDIVQRQTVVMYERQASDGTEYLEVVTPVFRRGAHFGALRSGISEAAYRQALDETERAHRLERRKVIQVSVAMSATLTLLGAALMIGLARTFSRPIVALTENARSIRQGHLDVTFPKGPADEIGTLAETMAEMVQGLRDRDFVRDVLGRYVTPELARTVLEDPDSLHLGGSEVDLTILMSDLRGFTSLSSTLGPERMVALLNRYLGAMSEVIVQYGGTINEFIGDAILVLFGAPVAQEDHALRAARCAVAMQQAMVRFNEDSHREGLPELQMGIGLSSGVVVAGNLGSVSHAKYGVVGPPVNMAGRVEALTIGFQVLMTEDTWAHVRHQVRVGEPMRVQMKGKAEPLVVYELHGVDDLQMPERAQRGVATDLGARWSRLRGKAVESDQHPAHIITLGPESAVLETTESLSALDNLVLRIDLADGATGDIYGKVISVEANGEGLRAEVHFTSIADADRDALDASLS